MRRAKFIVPILSIVALTLFGLVALRTDGLFHLGGDVPSVAAIGGSAEEQDPAGGDLDPPADDPLVTLGCVRLEIAQLPLPCATVLGGLTNYNEVVEQQIVNEMGQEQIIPVPGRLHYDPIVVTVPYSSSNGLWDWRQQVVEGDVEAARKHGSIVVYDQTGVEIGQWDFVEGWPCRYEGPTYKASAPALVETIVICHEGFSPVD